MKKLKFVSNLTYFSVKNYKFSSYNLIVFKFRDRAILKEMPGSI